MAMTLAVVEELQVQLLTQEELNSREEAIIVWEDGLITFERALGRACMERDAECAETEAVR
jgi:TATA-binding protein-associated factor Taf7